MKKFYIFDFDGTLVDSMPYWAGVHIKALEDNGIEVPENFVEAITPLGNDRASKYTISLGLDISLEKYIENVSKTLYHYYSEVIPLKSGVKTSLERFEKEGISLNVLTASPHFYLDIALKRLGVYELFDNVWSIDDFGLTKAEPQIYTEAAKRLGADVKECVFFDDNFIAVSTAKKAGMQTVAVYDDSSAGSREAMEKTADRYIYSFTEFCE